jgi:hypothetical protein
MAGRSPPLQQIARPDYMNHKLAGGSPQHGNACDGLASRPASQFLEAFPRRRLSGNADGRVVFIRHSGLSAQPDAQALVGDDVNEAERHQLFQYVH